MHDALLRKVQYFLYITMEKSHKRTFTVLWLQYWYCPHGMGHGACMHLGIKGKMYFLYCLLKTFM